MKGSYRPEEIALKRISHRRRARKNGLILGGGASFAIIYFAIKMIIYDLTQILDGALPDEGKSRRSPESMAGCNEAAHRGTRNNLRPVAASQVARRPIDQPWM